MNKEIESSIKDLQIKRKLLQAMLPEDLIAKLKAETKRLKTTQVKLIEAILRNALLK